jgi:hypothetical protein
MPSWTGGASGATREAAIMKNGHWSWFAAGLFVGFVLFVVLVWLFFLGFGFNV